MANGVVKNQHYVPVSSLIHFANEDGKVFEALLVDEKIYGTAPENAMSQSYVYEDDGLKINTVEKFLGKYENEVAPKIVGLIKAIEGHKAGQVPFPNLKALVEELLEPLMVYYYRSGALLQEFSTSYPEGKILLLGEKILNTPYIKALAKMIGSSYKFGLIESEQNFLISDQCVSTCALKLKSNFSNMSNRHMGLKETLILIPISASFYAAYWHTDGYFFGRENDITKIDGEDLQMINRAIINNSYKKCVGAKKEALEGGLPDYNHESPSTIYMGFRDGSYGGAVNKKEVFFYDIDKEMLALLLQGTGKYQGLGRNDSCKCDSGKKYKKCHEEMVNNLNPIIRNIIASQKGEYIPYHIPGAQIVEKPIHQWGELT